MSFPCAALRTSDNLVMVSSFDAEPVRQHDPFHRPLIRVDFFYSNLLLRLDQQSLALVLEVVRKLLRNCRQVVFLGVKDDDARCLWSKYTSHGVVQGNAVVGRR